MISNFAKVKIPSTNIQQINHERRKRFYLKRVEIWVHIDLGLQTVMWINLVFACHFMKGWVISGYTETEYNRDDAYVYLWRGKSLTAFSSYVWAWQWAPLCHASPETRLFGQYLIRSIVNSEDGNPPKMCFWPVIFIAQTPLSFGWMYCHPSLRICFHYREQELFTDLR